MSEPAQCESVWELPEDAFDSPCKVAQLIDEALDSNNAHLAFGLADGLYWYASDFHTSQVTELYVILSELDFNPGAATQPEEDGQYVYDMLVGADQLPGMNDPV